MKSIVDRLRKWEKAKGWGGGISYWIESKIERHFFYIGEYMIIINIAPRAGIWGTR